MKLKYWCFLK